MADANTMTLEQLRRAAGDLGIQLGDTMIPESFDGRTWVERRLNWPTEMNRALGDLNRPIDQRLLKEDRIKATDAELRVKTDQIDNQKRILNDAGSTTEQRRKAAAEMDRLERERAKIESERGLSSIQDELDSLQVEEAARRRQRVDDLRRPRYEAYLDKKARRAARAARLKATGRLGVGALLGAAALYGVSALNDLKAVEETRDRLEDDEGDGAADNAAVRRKVQSLERALRSGSISQEDYDTLLEEYDPDEIEMFLEEGRAAAAEGRDLVDEAESLQEVEREYPIDGQRVGPTIERALEMEPINAGYVPDDDLRTAIETETDPDVLQGLIGAEFDAGLENLATGFEDVEDPNALQRAIQRYVAGEPLIQGSVADAYASIRDGATNTRGRIVDRIQRALPGVNPDVISGIAEAAAFPAEMVFPRRLGEGLESGLDAAGELYTLGELSGANDSLSPLFREFVLGPLGRDPMGRAAAAGNAAGVDFPPVEIGRAPGQPTAPNAFNSPSSFDDLLAAEESGMLPFPGTAEDNARRLGIVVPADADAVLAGMPPSEGQGLDTDVEDAIDQLSRQDEATRPRGQFVAPTAPRPSGVEPYSFDPGPSETDDPVASMPGSSPLEPSIDSLPDVDMDTPPFYDNTGGEIVTADASPTMGKNQRPRARSDASVGTDYNTQRGKSIEDDQDEEEQLNWINRQMRDRFGMDAEQREKAANALISFGGGLASTPGNFLTGFAVAGRDALDAYNETDQRMFEEGLLLQEEQRRAAADRRQASLDKLKEEEVPDTVRYFALRDALLSSGDYTQEEADDIARAAVGWRAAPRASEGLDAFLAAAAAGLG